MSSSIDPTSDAAWWRSSQEEEAMTLMDLHALAILWCPVDARWTHLMDRTHGWGHAHEIGHALIESRWRWKLSSYGHCQLAFCECGPTQPCSVAECAAMYISQSLLTTAGYPELAAQEIEDTTDYALLDEVHFKRAKTLLKRKHLWPVPRTRRSLEAALKAKLGKPRGEAVVPQSVQRARGRSVALSLFENLLLNLR